MTDPSDLHKSTAQGSVLNESEVILSARNVSKKFCKRLRRSMAYGLIDLTKNLFGIKPDSAELRKEEFWALKNIDFELRRGDVLGLIGVNGSGKTTLLRLLSGIFPPDRGEIMIKGKVGALIALGAGFHPYFSGRENIYLNGAILGISRDELDAQFDKIVEFSEIGDFIDAPVATYSSGMRVRLGFSVAIAMKPDVLLIDEVLAVGDLGFKVKCLNEINELMKNAVVIFVSHSMQLVARISTQIMVLHEGRISHHGHDVGEGIDCYTSRLPVTEQRTSGSGKATISNVRIGKDLQLVSDCQAPSLNYGEDLSIEFVIELESSVKKPAVNVFILNQEMYPVAECFSENCGFSIEPKQGKKAIKVKFRNIQFNAGMYSVGVIVFDLAARDEILLRTEMIAAFQVNYFTRSWSSIILSGEWEQQNL